MTLHLFLTKASPFTRPENEKCQKLRPSEKGLFGNDLTFQIICKMEANGHGKEEFSQEIDAAFHHLTNRVVAFQVYTTTLLQALRQKLYIIHHHTLELVERLAWKEKLEILYSNAGTKGHELLELLKNQELVLCVSRYIGNIHTVLHSQVSKQALFFGCAGLLTGGVIGLWIGYSAKTSYCFSQYSFNGTSNSLMRAIITTNSKRGIDGITMTSVPVPNILRSDEILVQVKAVGLDNIDAKIANGYGHIFRYHSGINRVKEPFTLGRECSGIVVDIGHQVVSFEINDRVWVCMPFCMSSGVLSEYIVVPDKLAGHKPKNIGFEGAATLPYASMVVWRDIVAKAQLGPHTAKNKRVLIHLGATSKNDGVGLLATQVLKTWGARITISTEENVDEDNQFSGSGVPQMTFLHSLKSLGAESHLIIPQDHSQLPNLTQRIFDVVVNTDTRSLSPILKNFCKDPNGEVIETFPKEFGLKSFRLWDFLTNWIFSSGVQHNESPQPILNECKRLIETGLVVPVVAKSFLISQYDQAFRHVANTTNSALAHAHIGKSVLVFKPS